MSSAPKKERRKYNRFDTDLKIKFYVNFDVETKVDFRVKKGEDAGYSRKKYHGLSRNISAEGICFSSTQKLKHGEILLIELTLPSSKDVISMVGHVRWSHLSEEKHEKKDMYETGVLLEMINGEAVADSVYFDEENHIIWSSVLETVFGSFKTMSFRRKNNPT